MHLCFNCNISNQTIFAIILMLLLQCIVNEAAMKCYVCDSTDNPSCADLKTNTSIMPEECSHDKMKSIDTWLFELNRFAYFDNGAVKNPSMNCQKVIARDPNTSKMVTARFCQLESGDSDPCQILRSKLRISDEDSSKNTKNRNKKQQNADGNDDEAESQFHCSICTEDSCNGSDQLRGIYGILLLVMFFLPQRSIW